MLRKINHIIANKNTINLINSYNHKQLSEVEVYEPLESNPIEDISKVIGKRYIRGISEENRVFLLDKDLRLGRFYLSPKIHKRLLNAMGSGFPFIISNFGTPTEQISAFVDFHLQPVVKTLPYVVKDTTAFLCKLREIGVLREGTIFCTMDAVELYPHIPQKEGLLSMGEILREFAEGHDLAVWVRDLVDLAKLN